ncbi:phage portal protein [Herbiconiux flava]|uniref:Phage portal protein n=1 Tax=Herbiconiux flava TaxID=881268 RepID=A0A852SUP3_9MICO|nr:phage portal protein [Herbiconiux flava]NYD72300.1 hypothetical protein [Herbiconiux flava]
MTRGDAIAIPAVSKARNLLVTAVCGFPMRALDVNGLVKDQPTWMYRTNSNVSPYERMTWTVDDGIFYGYSLWLTERGPVAPGAKRGPLLNAAWCPTTDWTVTDNQLIYLPENRALSADEFILFNFPFEGLLNIGRRTLRGARDTEEAWVGRMRNPLPLINLHQTDDSLTPEQVKEFVNAWSKARRSVNGAIGYTPPGIELLVEGEVQTDLFTEGRNAIRTDIGSLLNVRASMLDGTSGIDSLTYTTKDGERNQFYELDLPFWTAPIEARLSMDDVVPRGQRIRFDKYDLYNPPAPTGTPVED